MGVMSRRVLPACGSLCCFCPSLRARSRQPVKRYKKLISDIFPRSQDAQPNERMMGKLCEYTNKNPMRIPKVLGESKKVDFPGVLSLHRKVLPVFMKNEAQGTIKSSRHKIFTPFCAVSSGAQNVNLSTKKFKDFVVSTFVGTDEEVKVRVDVSGTRTQEIFDNVFTKLVEAAQPIPGFRRVKGGEGSKPKVAAWLSNPLLTDDGIIYACSGKNLFSFDNNGTVVWIVPLGYLCSVEISPVVDDRGKIYLIAEDRILKITPSHVGTSMPTSEIFLGSNSTTGGSGEIIGLSISILYSSIFVTVKTHALFAFSLHGELLWSAGPILYRFGYRQGCKENLSDCYFNSAPVVDQCEGTLYISNTQGQLYSLYMRNQNFRWIHDFSSIDKFMTIIPGNNGLVYAIFPKKASVIALDVRTGNTSWQQNFGPLSSEQSLPVVDSNGWLSIGSLDGYLYSFSPTGEVKKLLHSTASDSVILTPPVLDCSGFSVYVLQTKMTAKSSQDIANYTYISTMNPASVVLTMLTPATGTVYWTTNYPGELAKLFPSNDLHYFRLDERVFLTFLSSARIGYTLPCHTMSKIL